MHDKKDTPQWAEIVCPPDRKFQYEHRMLKGHSLGRLFKNAIGPSDPRKPQSRNAPCGCGSGKKSKKCCGNYPKEK
jgi:uncharacterized protein YecA (UPF0149 family)